MEDVSVSEGGFDLKTKEFSMPTSEMFDRCLESVKQYYDLTQSDNYGLNDYPLELSNQFDRLCLWGKSVDLQALDQPYSNGKPRKTQKLALKLLADLIALFGGRIRLEPEMIIDAIDEKVTRLNKITPLLASPSISDDDSLNTDIENLPLIFEDPNHIIGSSSDVSSRDVVEKGDGMLEGFESPNNEDGYSLQDLHLSKSSQKEVRATIDNDVILQSATDDRKDWPLELDDEVSIWGIGTSQERDCLWVLLHYIHHRKYWNFQAGSTNCLLGNASSYRKAAGKMRL